MRAIIREHWRDVISLALECAVMVSLVSLAVCGGMVTTARSAELSRTAAYGAVSSLIWALVFAAAVRRVEREREDVYIERWTIKKQ